MFVLTTFVIAYHRVIKSSRTQPRNILSHWNQIHTIAIISLVPHLTTLENCRRATPGKRCRRYLPPSLSLSLSLSFSFSLSLSLPQIPFSHLIKICLKLWYMICKRWSRGRRGPMQQGIICCSLACSDKLNCVCSFVVKDS
jgi:hypothetical protein